MTVRRREEHGVDGLHQEGAGSGRLHRVVRRTEREEPAIQPTGQVGEEGDGAGRGVESPATQELQFRGDRGEAHPGPGAVKGAAAPAGASQARGKSIQNDADGRAGSIGLQRRGRRPGANGHDGPQFGRVCQLVGVSNRAEHGRVTRMDASDRGPAGRRTE